MKIDTNFTFNVPLAQELILRLTQVKVLRSSCEDSGEGVFRVHLPEKEWEEIVGLVERLKEKS